MHQPSLDDVFLRYTGKTIREEQANVHFNRAGIERRTMTGNRLRDLPARSALLPALGSACPATGSAPSSSRSSSWSLFSQLFKDIIQLPGFEESSYLAYLAPGQIVFAVFLGVSWVGINLLMDYHSGYLDKLRVDAHQPLSILFGEMVPLFFDLRGDGRRHPRHQRRPRGEDRRPASPAHWASCALSGLFGIAWAGTSFVPALLTKNEQAAGTLSLLFFPLAFMSTAFVPASGCPIGSRS